MDLRVEPEAILAGERLKVVGQVRPWQLVEWCWVEGEDPWSLDQTGDDQQVVTDGQIVADGDGHFEAYVRVPRDTDGGTHSIMVRTYSLPPERMATYFEVHPDEALQQRKTLCPKCWRKAHDEAWQWVHCVGEAVYSTGYEQSAEVEQNQTDIDSPPTSLRAEDFYELYPPRFLSKVAITDPYPTDPEIPDEDPPADPSLTPQLARSPWPMLDSNPKLTSSQADLNVDGIYGPDGPIPVAGITKMVKLWERTGLGLCVGNVSVGQDDGFRWAYYMAANAIQNDISRAYLYRLDMQNGGYTVNVVDLKAEQDKYTLPSGIPNQPLILQLDGKDRVFAPMSGSLYSFNASLGDLKRFPLFKAGEDLIPAHLNYSVKFNLLVFVAQGNGGFVNGEPQAVYPCVLWAVDPLTMKEVVSVDVGYDIAQDLVIKDEISCVNTASIGPNPDNAAEDHVYVLIDEWYVLCYRLFRNHYGVIQLVRRWPAAGHTLEFEIPIEGDPGYHQLGNSQSSPAISPDGATVFICEGDYPHKSIDTPLPGPKLLAFDARTGARVAEYAFEPGSVIASSLVVEYDQVRKVVMVYVDLVGRPAYGFEFKKQQSGSFTHLFKLRWQTDPGYPTLGTNDAKVGRYYYVSNRSLTAPENFYFGAFDASRDTTSASPIWSISTGRMTDICTRAFNFFGQKKQLFIGAVGKVLDGRTAVPVNTLQCWEERSVLDTTSRGKSTT